MRSQIDDPSTASHRASAVAPVALARRAECASLRTMSADRGASASRVGDGDAGLARARAAASDGSPWRVGACGCRSLTPGKVFGCRVNFRHHGIPDPAFVYADRDTDRLHEVPSGIVGAGRRDHAPAQGRRIRAARGFRGRLRGRAGGDHRPAGEAGLRPGADHVFGYTFFNDVSARRVQPKDRQPDLGKNFDTFARER